MADDPQKEFKISMKLWLKSSGFDYAWLATHCFVTETTVRNWMAKKSIPAAKCHIINSLMRDIPLSLGTRVAVNEETHIKLRLSSDARQRLDEKAAQQGKSLVVYLADAISELSI